MIIQEGLRSLIHEPKGQIRALDGVRALAILLVMSTHCAQVFSGSGGEAPNWLMRMPFVQGGWIGVDLFFALSGFFIGKQLWKEFNDSGSVDIPRFVLRRGLRIWPLYFTVFALSALSFVLLSKPLPRLWPEGFFISNYFTGSIVPGSWSLSSEEQFYLTVPTLILLLSFITRSMRAMRWLFYFFLALSPVVRAWTWQHVGGFGASVDLGNRLMLQHIYFPFHTHLDGLIIGMIFSNFATDKEAQTQGLLARPWVLLSLGCASAVVLKMANHVIFEYTGLALIFGSLVWLCVRTQGNWLTKFLGWRGFYLVSKLSYGMYLMHQFVMPPAVRWATGELGILPTPLQFIAAFAFNLAMTLALAAAGYVAIEYPFLQLRTRLGLVGIRHRPGGEPADPVELAGLVQESGVPAVPSVVVGDRELPSDLIDGQDSRLQVGPLRPDSRQRAERGLQDRLIEEFKSVQRLTQGTGHQPRGGSGTLRRSPPEGASVNPEGHGGHSP
jgi:peptidoglycan/LPS O-acetylase OafA/YrhL